MSDTSTMASSSSTAPVVPKMSTPGLKVGQRVTIDCGLNTPDNYDNDIIRKSCNFHKLTGIVVELSDQYLIVKHPSTDAKVLVRDPHELGWLNIVIHDQL